MTNLMHRAAHMSQPHVAAVICGHAHSCTHKLIALSSSIEPGHSRFHVRANMPAAGAMPASPYPICRTRRLHGLENKATLCSHQREIPCQSSMASPFLSPTPMLAPVHLEVARVCKSWTKAVAHQPVLLGIVPANLRFGGNTEDGVCSWNA